MSPSGFNIRSRRSQASIRVLSLTPSGVSTNSVLNYILDDLVSCSTRGVECIDAFGDKVRVYIDVMGYLGDYPASSSVIDVGGHTSNAPCTHCSFHVSRDFLSSKYAFTTSVHSCNTSYRRTQHRMSSIRKIRLKKDHRKLLGLKLFRGSNVNNLNQAPLLKLAELYNNALTLLSSDPLPPFQLHPKDGYSLNVVAPDHLITGLFTGILTCTFLHIDDDTKSGQLDTLLRESLSLFGFQSQSRIVTKKKKKKLVTGLTMSMLYSILIVLPSALEAIGLFESIPTRKLIINLHRFCSLAFWWPDYSADGEHAWTLVHGSQMSQYHKSLYLLASNFVKSVESYSSQYPDYAKFVDRPNTHRLLELALHTIPMFDNVNYVCELVFESTHQPLKFFLSRNHTAKSHIYSVQLMLARDWLVRIWSLWQIFNSKEESASTKRFAMTGLFRMFGGSLMESINWNSDQHQAAFATLSNHISDLLSTTAEGRLQKWYDDTVMRYETVSMWEVLPLTKKQVLLDPQHDFLKKCMSFLVTICHIPSSAFKLGTTSLLRRKYGKSGSGSHERLVVGDVIQLLLPDDASKLKFLDASVSPKGTPYFFVIGGFIRHSKECSWAIIRPCVLDESATVSQLPMPASSPPFIRITTTPFYTSSFSTVQFVRLSSVVRKVGCFHNCAAKGQCTFSNRSSFAVHSHSTTDGGSFLLISRSLGYPPRRS